ncbi:MAG TPA: lipopolysaccharide biosynthesis protein [Candidatus Eisenbacteria bacterium]|nr:lipopolysaccharide biosynthesis protein [Candidatus Eisenbacteria bacterium]
MSERPLAAAPPAANEPPLARHIARSSVAGIAARGVSIVGWTLLAPVLVRHLGRDRFGLWSLLTVIAGVYTTLDLGLTGALTKFVAEYRAGENARALRAVYSTAVVAYGALAVLVVAVVAATRLALATRFHVPPALRGEAAVALVVAACVYGITSVYTLLASVLGGLQRLDRWNQIAAVVTLVQLAGTAWVLTHGGGLLAVLAVAGVATLAGTVAVRVAIGRLAPEIRFDVRAIDASLLGRVSRYGLALQVVTLGVMAQWQLDKVLFGAMLSLALVGEFELGYRLVQAVWSLPALLLPPLLPAMAHLDAAGDAERLRRLYRRASRYVLALAFPVSAGTIVLAPIVFQAWLGPGHAQGALAAEALALMLGVNVLTGVGSAMARGTGRPWMEAQYQMLALALHLAASLTLIPRFGFQGGLLALVTSSAIGSLWFFVRVHRALDEPVGRFVVRIVLPAAAIAALAAAIAGWAGGARDPGLGGWTRATAIGHLAIGAAAMLATTAVGYAAARILRPAEVVELARIVRSRT